MLNKFNNLNDDTKVSAIVVTWLLAMYVGMFLPIHDCMWLLGSLFVVTIIFVAFDSQLSLAKKNGQRSHKLFISSVSDHIQTIRRR